MYGFAPHQAADTCHDNGKISDGLFPARDNALEALPRQALPIYYEIVMNSPLPAPVAPPPGPRVLEIFYFDAGGGHRAAMTSLRSVIAERHPDWTVVPVDLQHLLEPVDPVHRVTARVTRPLRQWLAPVAPNLRFGPVQSQSVYNAALRHGVTYSCGVVLPMLKLYIKRHSPAIEAVLRAYWCASERPVPDMVVSVIPNFNGCLFRALKAVHPDVAYVTIMTDLLDCPPRFWMEDQDQVLIVGTKRAARQARESGFYAPHKVFQVSGMMLRPEFSHPPARPALTRQDLGLSPNRPVALVMFGGNGSGSARLIVAKLAAAFPALQTIVLCGSNLRLLQQLGHRQGCAAVGFVGNVADYMRLADFFIGKPGPGSLSEAVQTGCPVIVEGNARTMPQERPNLAWVKENRLGIVVRSFRRSLVKAVRRMLSDLPIYQANLRRNVPANRAVFEVVEILEQVPGRERRRDGIEACSRDFPFPAMPGGETGAPLRPPGCRDRPGPLA